jgi:DNA repair exonuclease SbcCD ATPase subunit
MAAAMDRATFCNDVEARMREFDTFLQEQRYTRPSTAEKTRQIEQRYHTVEAIRGRIADIRAKVAQLKSSTDSQWAEPRAAIERECEAVERQVAELRGAR